MGISLLSAVTALAPRGTVITERHVVRKCFQRLGLVRASAQYNAHLLAARKFPRPAGCVPSHRSSGSVTRLQEEEEDLVRLVLTQDQVWGYAGRPKGLRGLQGEVSTGFVPPEPPPYEHPGGPATLRPRG